MRGFNAHRPSIPFDPCAPRQTAARPAVWLGSALLAVGASLLGGISSATAQDPATSGTDGTQPPPVQPVASEVQPTALEAQIQQIEGNSELPVEEKASLAAIYKKALEAAKAAEQWRAKADQFTAIIQSVADDLIAAREEQAALKAKPQGEPPPQRPLAELEQLLLTKESELVKLQQSAAEWEAAQKTREDRSIEISKRLPLIKEQLTEVEKQLAATSSLDTAVARANRIGHLSRQAELTGEMAALEKEVQSYTARVELLPLRRDLAQRRLAREQAFVKQLRDKVFTLRKVELEQRAAIARCEAIAANPLVKELAEEYAQLAERSLALAQSIQNAGKQASAAQARHEKLREERRRTEERIERTGLNRTFGALLAKQRDQLPNRRNLQRSIADRSDKIDQIRLALYELQDNRKQFSDGPEEVEAYLRTVQAEVDETDLWLDLEEEIRDLLTERLEIYNELETDYNQYLIKIVDLDTAERDLLAERDAFAAYIDQRVLWLPNMSAVGLQDVAGAWHVIEWLGRPGDWLNLVQALASDAAQYPLLTLGFLTSLVALVVLRPKLRGYVRNSGVAAMRGSFDRFGPTLGVAGATAVLAVPAAWIMSFLAWRIGNMEAPNRLAVPLSSGLAAVALLVLVVEVWRQVCRPSGLGEAHFGWSESGLKAIRQRLNRWIGPVGVIVLLVAAMSAMEDDQQAASLGRLTFVVGMLAATVPLYRTLHPEQWLLRDFLAWNRDGWLYRLRYLWFVGFVLAPPALAILAMWGYYYTALELTFRAFATLCFGGGLIITREMIFRALLIARRRLAMEQARQRRAAARAAAEAAEEGAAGESQAITVEEPLVDLSAISGQTRRLVRAFLVMTALVATYAIWVDVLPALAVLDRVDLWTTEAAEVITLKSALFATLIGMLTFVAWKNIPGLLEIAVLQRLPMEASSRFAVATLTSYFIAVIGTVATFKQFGVGWQSVQWLVAAMTVGLGFGLQEIFANFVSGLIILFERPIRVGDVVTAGDVTGAVTKIRIRATTITNWDRKELIIPNKEFVTGRVMNWTLSDQVNRITVNVGVAYGTEATRVLKILEEIANGHPMIMEDPAPMVTFEEFGASSLNFVLRAYLPNLEIRLKTITELHQTIQRRFAENDIEIAFPQQDIHVRSIDAALPFLTRLREDDDEQADAA